MPHLPGAANLSVVRWADLTVVRSADPGVVYTPACNTWAAWIPERLLAWAAKIGPEATAALAAVLASRAHPQQAFCSCLGVLRLAERFGDERLIAACRYARTMDAVGYKNIRHILKAALDTPAAEPPAAAPGHDNVRGADYYRQET